MTLRKEGKGCCLGNDQIRDAGAHNGLTVRERNLGRTHPNGPPNLMEQAVKNYGSKFVLSNLQDAMNTALQESRISSFNSCFHAGLSGSLTYTQTHTYTAYPVQSDAGNYSLAISGKF